jgi:hypothetical protein
MLNSAAQDENSLEEDHEYNYFCRCFRTKICSLGSSTFLGRMYLGKKLLFYFFSKEERGNARNPEVIILIKCLLHHDGKVKLYFIESFVKKLGNMAHW